MKYSTESNFSVDLTRLFAAAVVSPQFCQLLLVDAATALREGYHGESFRLPASEEKLVTSIRAASLTDFARQVVNGQVERKVGIGDKRAPSIPAHRFENRSPQVLFAGD